jgi:rod shape-determining protein MreD
VLKKYPFYTVTLAVLVLVQHFILSRVVIFGASPDLLAVFIAFASMMIGQRTGTTYGFAAGVFAGFLSGDIGLSALVGTIEGFTAGYFHVPEGSYATSTKKRRMFYYAALAALASGNLTLAIAADPMGIPLYLRLPSLVILGTGMSMALTVLAYRLVLKKLHRD